MSETLKQMECPRCKSAMTLEKAACRCPECNDGQTYRCPQCGTRVWVDDIGEGLVRYCVLPEG